LSNRAINIKDKDMRETKFRVWTGSKMEYNIMAGFLGAFYVKGIDEKDSACISPFNTKYPDVCPLMQYTGLNDKSGKEIYEGDIVTFKEWRDAYQEYEDKIMKVEYLEGFFCPLVSFGDEPSSKNYEVIGNIYQNPELLTK
jgi:uncharacterized phage protein (TIGR01671 family)